MLHFSSNPRCLFVNYNHSVVILCYISNFSWFRHKKVSNALNHIKPKKQANWIFLHVIASNGRQYTKIVYIVQWLSLLKWPLNSTVWQASLLNWKSVQSVLSLIHTTIDFQMLHFQSRCHLCSKYTHFPHTYWFVSGLCNLGGGGALRESELTVVVLTRPPGCVQVQPDLLTNRSQPSSSKHGTISHHCFFRTMPAAENTGWEKRQLERREINRRREMAARWMLRRND